MNREEKLRDVIKEQYGTQLHFCESNGIPQNTLASALSKGLGKTNVDLIIKICDALSIDVRTFEPIAIKESELSQNEAVLVAGYRRMPKEVKAFVLEGFENYKNGEWLDEIEIIDEEDEKTAPVTSAAV